ncbi:MAG: hypothetical protein AAGJ80_09895, partial [Cyanobacteria bacterium J06553_1]
MYTIIAMFTHAWGQQHDKIIKALNVERPKVTAYRGFEDWFADFEKRAMPFMKKQCLALLQNCRQEDNESLEDYRDRYVELLTMTDQKQSEYCWMYSDGIRRKNQRDAIIAGCGETDLLTIDQAYEIARRVEMFEQNSYR